MSLTVDLIVKNKDKQGKGAARAARRKGVIPCVVYGGKQNPVSLIVEPAQVKSQLRHGTFFTSIYDLILNGNKKEHVIARDFQVDPITEEILHIDFMRITDSTRINVQVPIYLENEDKCPGIKIGGGLLQIIRPVIELNCRASEIPTCISIDLSNFNIGDLIRISDTTLPEGVNSIIDRDFTIALISSPRGTVEDINEDNLSENGINKGKSEH